jgi:hypothetical protein
MPSKETKTKKTSARREKKDCNALSLSYARLGKTLGRIHKNAESAMNTEGLPEKTKKAIAKVCTLVEEAIQQQPKPLPATQKRRTSSKKTSLRRATASK